MTLVAHHLVPPPNPQYHPSWYLGTRMDFPAVSGISQLNPSPQYLYPMSHPIYLGTPKSTVPWSTPTEASV